jgi:hypothetical protein
VLKHARPAAAVVRVAYELGQVVIEVTDDGKGLGSASGRRPTDSDRQSRMPGPRPPAVMATAAGLAPGRVEEVLSQTGLAGAAGRRVGGFSLGLLLARGATVTVDGPDRLVVGGATAEQVGQAAAAGGVVLHEMRFERSNLEDVFLELTGGKGDPR